MNDTDIKKYIDEQVTKQVTERMQFVYNTKYRFDKPVEISKKVNVSSPTIVTPNLPTSSTGLVSGQWWNDTNTIKIIP